MAKWHSWDGLECQLALVDADIVRPQVAYIRGLASTEPPTGWKPVGSDVGCKPDFRSLLLWSASVRQGRSMPGSQTPATIDGKYK
jgi:hypothetical protein